MFCVCVCLCMCDECVCVMCVYVHGVCVYFNSIQFIIVTCEYTASPVGAYETLNLCKN